MSGLKYAFPLCAYMYAILVPGLFGVVYLGKTTEQDHTAVALPLQLAVVLFLLAAAMRISQRRHVWALLLGIGCLALSLVDTSPRILRDPMFLTWFVCTLVAAATFMAFDFASYDDRDSLRIRNSMRSFSRFAVIAFIMIYVALYACARIVFGRGDSLEEMKRLIVGWGGASVFIICGVLAVMYFRLHMTDGDGEKQPK